MFKKVPSTIDVYYILQSFTGLTTSPNIVFFIQRAQSFVSKNSYIYIVGEVRGKEAMELLNSYNTGHDGGMSTGHGNSPADMLSRLETMVLMGADLPLAAIRSQIASALDILIHLGRLRDKSRRVLQITEVDGYEDGEIRLRTLYEFEEEDHEKDSDSQAEKNRRQTAAEGRRGQREKTPVAGRLRKRKELKSQEKLKTAGESL